MNKKKINKHPVLPFPATQPADMLLFLPWLMWTVPCVILKEVFFAGLLCGHNRRITWKNTLCQPAAPRAHKQDHLAIISSQPRIHAQQSRRLSRKMGDGGRGGKNTTGGERVGVERRSDGEGRGWLLEPGRGHGVPVGRNSGKHP